MVGREEIRTEKEEGEEKAENKAIICAPVENSMLHDVHRSLCKHDMHTNTNAEKIERWDLEQISLSSIIELGTGATLGQPEDVTGKWNRNRLWPSYIPVLAAIWLSTSTESSNPLPSLPNVSALPDLILIFGRLSRG